MSKDQQDAVASVIAGNDNEGPEDQFPAYLQGIELPTEISEADIDRIHVNANRLFS